MALIAQILGVIAACANIGSFVIEAIPVARRVCKKISSRRMAREEEEEPEQPESPVKQ